MFNRTTGLMGALLIVVGAVVTEVDEAKRLENRSLLIPIFSLESITVRHSVNPRESTALDVPAAIQQRAS